MSKSITVTLPNATADSLERYMESLNSSLPPGSRRSKSDFVATAVKASLEKAGVCIVSDIILTAPPISEVPDHERMEL